MQSSTSVLAPIVQAMLLTKKGVDSAILPDSLIVEMFSTLNAKVVSLLASSSCPSSSSWLLIVTVLSPRDGAVSVSIVVVVSSLIYINVI